MKNNKIIKKYTFFNQNVLKDFKIQCQECTHMKEECEFEVSKKLCLNGHDNKLYKYYWIPKLNRRSLFENLNSQFHLSMNEEDEIINIVGREDGELYGTVRNHINLKHNSNKQIIFLMMIFVKKPLTFKIKFKKELPLKSNKLKN